MKYFLILFTFIYSLSALANREIGFDISTMKNQTSKPSNPKPGYKKIYFKNDKLTSIDSDGIEELVTNGDLSGDIESSGLVTTYNGIVPIAKGGTGLSAAGASGNILTSDGTDWVSMPVAGLTTYNATLSNGLIYPIWDFTSPVKLTNPATLPTGIGFGTSWSPDGQFLTVVHSTTPFITIYQRSGTTFTKLANPATLPTGTGFGAAWSPDGQFLTVGHSTTPFITIYQRNGTTFTKLSDPATLPPNTGRGMAWSPNGQFLTVTHNVTPFITIYERSGTTFTKLTDPATLPTGTGYGIAWSPDGQFLTVAHDTSPFITIYQRSGTTFTKLANPAALPAGTGSGIAWSPDGQFLTVAHSTTPFITIYRTSSDTPFAKGSPVTTTVINREIR